MVFVNSSNTESSRGGIFKILRIPGIDFKKLIPLAYVARRAGTTAPFLPGFLPCSRTGKPETAGTTGTLERRENQETAGKTETSEITEKSETGEQQRRQK
jgi:hypothetical protein